MSGVKRAAEISPTQCLSGVAAKTRLPFLIWVVGGSTLLACVGGEVFFGYRISGLAWAIPLGFALLTFLTNRRRMAFPVRLWLPWVIWAALYLAVAEAPNALQRTVMMFVPLLVGMAASQLTLDEWQWARVLSGIYRLAGVFLVIVLIKSGMLLTGRLPDATPLAAEAISAALLAVFFAAAYVHGQKRAILWWWAMLLVPVLALTRTVIAVTLLTFPLTFAPQKAQKRLIILALIAACGLGLFYTERVQRQMFFSGRGNLSDLYWGNPDFATSGRSVIWERLLMGIEDEPLWGHGVNATEEVVLSIVPGLTHPHNDWLRIAYDYGWIGVGVFAFCLLLQVWHLLRLARLGDVTTSLLFQVGAGSMLVFALIMLTDNILLYAAFFGNLQFLLMGIAYGRLRDLGAAARYRRGGR